jgi:cellulose synthase/poly-beta-1,6-N-acetylglucosamine synthase-like glycosyltransferase
MIETLGLALLGIQILIFLYFVFINTVYSSFLILSLLDIRKQLAVATRPYIRSLIGGAFYKPISIIVPAFNESRTIVSTVSFLLALRYPEFEIIVVDDGSTDGMMELLTSELRLVRTDRPLRLVLPHQPIAAHYLSLNHPNLTVVSKENGGKADALNAGVNVSRFPLFCCVDADSLLENDALLRAAKPFVEDRKVVATGGIVRTLNGCRVINGRVSEIRAPEKAIEKFQAVEYIRGFLTGRTSWNFMNSLLIISGAFGIFRKNIVMEIGGYRKTVGEDMDLVVRIHRYCCDEKIPYRIVFVPDPVCWTQVPSDLRSLLRQRNRWHRGLVDSLWHNRGMFLNPKYGSVGLFGFPYFLFVEALGPIIEFIGYASFVILFLLGYVHREFALLFLLLAVLWGMWLNLGSILLDNLIYHRYRGVSDLLKLSLFALLEFFGYRQLIVVERLIATFQFWKKGWGKQKRQGIRHEQTRKIH